MSSLKNMFAPIEDYEEDKEYDESEEESDEWEADWERMQERAVVDKRKLKTIKRLKANGEY